MSSETMLECPIQLTQGAIGELKKIIADKNIPSSHGLRLGVKGGGCAGFSYILGFDEKKEQDAQFEIDGLTIYIEKSNLLYLHGTELDFKDGLNARGFAFSNPNASKTCGCGSSFSA